MGISLCDTKLLWGRAAGFCSNPACTKELTSLIKNNASYNIGEMAHIIARQPDGPRGQQGGGANSYENLILLCPTCHRMIDKAPEGEFPVDLLQHWKIEHEEKIQHIGKSSQFENVEQLKLAVGDILIENRMRWNEFGPNSEEAKNNPTSNLYNVWALQKLSTIVPNNKKIINLIQTNIHLLSKEKAIFFKFKIHAEAFEANQYDRLDRYPLFPKEFGEEFGND